MQLRTASFMKGISLIALFLAGQLQAGQVSAPDPLLGDGRVSDFYIWDKDIPKEPGKLLRSETLESTLGLANAKRQYRILFSSTDGGDGKEPIVVSGALFLPDGQVPKDGWPLVSWGHGTFGGADFCAHSWHARSYRDVRYLNAWLKEGYAVVASDYQGIGVPGYNPQFNNRSNAYTILDASRAVLQSFKELNNRILLIGQSQGGSAVVAAGGYAPEYAPDLDIRGIIGTGIVYTSKHSAPEKIVNEDTERNNKVDPTIAYSFYHVLAAQAADPQLDVTAIYTDLAMPLLDQARTSCLAALEADVVGLELTRATTYKPGYEQILAKSSEKYGDDVGRAFPSVKLAFPLFIGVGEQDHLLSAGKTLARDACEAGTTVELHVYKQRDHSGTVNQSLHDSIPFARKVLAGETVKSVCSSQ